MRPASSRVVEDAVRYRLLSPCRRAPEAVIIGRGNADEMFEKDSAWRKGPGEYNVRPSWERSNVRMTGVQSPFRPTALVPEGAPVDTYPPRPVSSPRKPADQLSNTQSTLGSSRGQQKSPTKGFTLSGKLDRLPPTSSPGPGSYETTVSSFSGRNPNNSGRCTFGIRGTTPKGLPVPAPPIQPASPRLRALKALEEANVAKQKSAGRGMSMGAKWREAPPPVGPTATSYTLPTSFDGSSRGTSIHGRLKHPMDDHLATHDCAKTSVPHDPLRRLKAKVRS